MNPEEKKKTGEITQDHVEEAIRAEPETINYLLTDQDRADINMNDELRDIMKNIIITSVLCLIAIIV